MGAGTDMGAGTVTEAETIMNNATLALINTTAAAIVFALPERSPPGFPMQPPNR